MFHFPKLRLRGSVSCKERAIREAAWGLAPELLGLHQRTAPEILQIGLFILTLQISLMSVVHEENNYEKPIWLIGPTQHCDLRPILIVHVLPVSDIYMYIYNKYMCIYLLTIFAYCVLLMNQYLILIFHS